MTIRPNGCHGNRAAPSPSFLQAPYQAQADDCIASWRHRATRSDALCRWSAAIPSRQHVAIGAAFRRQAHTCFDARLFQSRAASRDAIRNELMAKGSSTRTRSPARSATAKKPRRTDFIGPSPRASLHGSFERCNYYKAAPSGFARKPSPARSLTALHCIVQAGCETRAVFRIRQKPAITCRPQATRLE